MTNDRWLLIAVVTTVIATGSARAEDKKIDLPGIEFGAAKVECKLIVKNANEVCAEGKLKAKGVDDGALAGAELCGKKLDGGGFKITGEAKAGEIKKLNGDKVAAFESKVEVQWKGDKVTKGKASVVVANTTKAPEKVYFTYDGKEFKKVDEKEYDKVDCEK